MRIEFGINWTVWVVGFEFNSWAGWFICLYFGPIHLHLGGK